MFRFYFKKSFYNPNTRGKSYYPNTFIIGKMSIYAYFKFYENIYCRCYIPQPQKIPTVK